MGAEEFMAYAEGADVDKAFDAARQQAQWEHGHRGYTGTIAEKDRCVVISRRTLSVSDAQDRAQRLLEQRDARVDDKFGPAGAIPVKTECRTVTVTGLSGTLLRHNSDEQAAFAATVGLAAREQGLLRDGEEVVTAHLQQYETPRARPVSVSYVGRTQTRARSTFTDGTAELTVKRSAEDLAAQTTPDGWLFFGVAAM